MIKIRRYREDDRSFVIDGLVDLQAVEAPLHDSRRPPERGFCSEHMSDALAEAKRKGGEFLIAMAGDEKVGFAAYWIEEDPTIYLTEDARHFGYVSDIWVAPEWRGKGAGRAMLDSIAERLRQRDDVKRLQITALTDNAPALRAYRSAGFEPYETTLELKIPGASG